MCAGVPLLEAVRTLDKIAFLNTATERGYTSERILSLSLSLLFTLTGHKNKSKNKRYIQQQKQTTMTTGINR